MSGQRTGALFGLLIIHLICLGVLGDYRLTTSVYSYTSNGQCAECRDSPDAQLSCCDNSVVTNPDECDDFSRLCDLFLSFCPRGLNTTVKDAQCPEGSLTTYTGDYEFDVTEHIFNPVLSVSLTVYGTPWTGLQVYFVLNDQDFGTPRIAQLVDSFAVDLTFLPGSTTPRTTYNGAFGLATIDVSFSLVCSPNFYGPDCTRSCDSNCMCDPGFTGEFCQTNINDCLLSVDCSGRGQCVDGTNSYTCDCDPGYTGADCENEIDECVMESVDCGDNRHCEDGLNNYTCVCDQGFTGDSCETNINDCLSVDCSGRGQCVDGVNNYTCVCNPGFTGALCAQSLSGSNAGSIAGGVIAGLVVLILVAIIVVVIIILYTRSRNKSIDINRNRTDSHGYDVIAPIRGTSAPPPQTEMRDRALSDHTYETLPDTGQHDLTNGTGTSYNEHEFQNPIYGDDEGVVPMTMVKRQLDNPTYGLGEDVATETKHVIPVENEDPGYEYMSPTRSIRDSVQI